MIRAHVAAFELLITSQPNPPTVYPGESPPLVTGGYVITYNDPGNREQVDLANSNPLMTWTVRTVCVGDTRDQSSLMLEKVRAGVEDKRPVVAGRACTPVHQILARLPERDDDSGESVFYAVADWRWYSHKSA